MAQPETNGVPSLQQDVEMKDDTSTQAPPEAISSESQPQTATAPAQAAPSPSPAAQPPAAIATPPPTTSTVPPPRPSSVAPTPARPEKPVAHGGPTRQYLNQNLTPHLLEGMKYLAVHEPEKPLLWLSEFLRDRSREIEG